jgi:hypothetical protein
MGILDRAITRVGHSPQAQYMYGRGAKLKIRKLKYIF